MIRAGFQYLPPKPLNWFPRFLFWSTPFCSPHFMWSGFLKSQIQSCPSHFRMLPWLPTAFRIKTKIFNIPWKAPSAFPAPSLTKRPPPLALSAFPLLPGLCSHNLEGLPTCSSPRKVLFRIWISEKASLSQGRLLWCTSTVFPIWSRPCSRFFLSFVISYWFVSLLY